MENKEDELDLDIDPEGAIVMAEDYHGDHTEDGVEEIVQETCETEKKSKKGKGSKGKRKQAGTGNLIINLFISIWTNNNHITHFFKNEMIFNTKTINIHKVITITFL